VASGAFDIALEATNADTAQGYQYELQWDDATLDFVSNTENQAGTGASLCSPVVRNASAPAGKEWEGNGAGCLRTSGTMPASVQLNTITLTCNVTDGRVTEIHLVTSTDDPVFGSTYFAPG